MSRLNDRFPSPMEKNPPFVLETYARGIRESMYIEAVKKSARRVVCEILFRSLLFFHEISSFPVPTSLRVLFRIRNFANPVDSRGARATFRFSRIGVHGGIEGNINIEMFFTGSVNVFLYFFCSPWIGGTTLSFRSVYA